jgi:hypothetical protein
MVTEVIRACGDLAKPAFPPVSRIPEHFGGNIMKQKNSPSARQRAVFNSDPT